MNQKGFTLTEIMVALAIFAIGIISASVLQANSLSIGKQAEISKKMTTLASAQLESQRPDDRSNVEEPSTGQSCDGAMPENYTCSVTVLPCDYASNTVSCREETIENPVGHYITVTIGYGDSKTLSLSTLVKVK